MKSDLILIIGPKHSGKSSAALALGKILGGEVLELDELMEKQTGKSPRELYREGKEIFQKEETKALTTAIQQGNQQNQRYKIVSAGGGLIDNNEALALLSQIKEIITVYLDAEEETTWLRLLNSGELPAFLDQKNPKESHRVIFRRRSESYRSLAKITIYTEGKSPDEIARDIIRCCGF